MQKATIELNNATRTPVGEPSGFLENIAYVLLLFLSFLLPIFFVPSIVFPFQFGKTMLISLFVLAAFVCWILARLKDGKFIFPSTKLLLSAGAVFLVSIISGIFSGSVKWSFVGQAVDLGTVGSLALLFILMFLVPVVFRSKDRIFYAYLFFFGSFFLIAVFHILRFIFGADFLALGIFNDLTSNTVGKWNDLGVFFGIGSMLSLITLELIALSKAFKILLYLALLVSLFFLALVNFAPVWYVLAFFSLIFLVYIISFDKSEAADAVEESSSGENQSVSEGATRKVPMTSLSMLLISLVFILGGNTIGPMIAGKLNITQIEARPSWAATFSVARNVLIHDPLLGAGPNRFADKWLLYKPDGINSTIFWNTNFSFGIGLVPTFLVTTGVLGALAWIIFFGLFLLVGFKAILSSAGDKVSRYLVTSSFLISLFLWIINIFYIPGMPIVALTFFFTGLFIAALYQSGAVKPKAVSFIEDPRKGFVSVLCLILLLIGTIATGYSFTGKFAGAVYFQKGSISFNNEGNVDKAYGLLQKAINLDPIALYYRSMVQLDLLRMSSLLSQNAKNVSIDALRNQFQGLLSTALGNAGQAVAIDPNDYQNWFALGQIYEAVVPLKIANAYESALNAYKQALSFNPKSPLLLLTIARLEASKGDIAKAKDYISQALQLKNNYTEAIFLLSQIQVAEGNLKDAISSVEAISYLSPGDSGALFQLGLLRYNNKDFQGAANALEQAVAINNSYANAKYFLGLSYYRLGRVADAIKQFGDLKITNPDNKEVDLILKNLNAGLAPFTNAAPPIDSQPEKRAKPPVTEKTDKVSARKKTSSASKNLPVNSDSLDTAI